MKNKGDKDSEAQRVAYLIALFIQGTISPEEHDELDAWVAESDDNMKLFEALTDENNIKQGLLEIEQAEWQQSSQKIMETAKKKKRNLNLRAWLIAASLILIAGAGWWYFSRSTKKEVPAYAGNVTEDRPPGGNKATLSLANGSVVVLDRARNGNVAVQGNAQVIKTDSSLSYNHLPRLGVAQEVVFNTLSTPKGGQYALTLSDGTRVWLNAASSIRFPTAFTGRERLVDITGEAYFEVAHNPAQPFLVNAGGVQVQVLGTHFSVNAYTDEEAVTTTLVEGSVKVSKGTISRIIKPDQQASVEKEGNAILITPVDAQEMVAWKDGLFVFSNTELSEVMRQLSRWYEVEVEIKDRITDHLNATFPRTLPLSKMLHLVEKTGVAHFKLQGGKLEVTK
jgi:ferric-dicitrate binding protein FerR (iron transport regulator)